MRIESDELDTFHKELAAKNYRYARPDIEKMPWGSTDMSVTDTFGNRLTFTSAISAWWVKIQQPYLGTKIRYECA